MVVHLELYFLHLCSLTTTTFLELAAQCCIKMEKGSAGCTATTLLETIVKRISWSLNWHKDEEEQEMCSLYIVQRRRNNNNKKPCIYSYNMLYNVFQTCCVAMSYSLLMPYYYWLLKVCIIPLYIIFVYYTQNLAYILIVLLISGSLFTTEHSLIIKCIINSEEHTYPTKLCLPIKK